jgi:hypothetical protein
VEHHGGDTCGPGPDGDPNGVFEDCCVSFSAPAWDGSNYVLDKYLVTAGRIRAFVTHFNGNLRQFTMAIPPDNPYWNHAWDQYIPSTMTEVDSQLGPYPGKLTPENDPPYLANGQSNFPTGFQKGQWRLGCTNDEHGARTWWSPNPPQGDTEPFGQDILDEKVINCIDGYLLSAFCIWDGGHLATTDELSAAWSGWNGQNNTSAPWPWSDRAPTVNIDTQGANPTNNPIGVDANGLDASSYIVHEFGPVEFQGPFSYTYPAMGPDSDPQTNLRHVPAPGRKPLGNAPGGFSDLAGVGFSISAIHNSTTPTLPGERVGSLTSGSWESHHLMPGPYNEDQDFTAAWWAYWAGVGRCAR